MTVLGDFLSPEAGQRRRAWLDEKLGAADEAMRYYLGPTGVPDKLKAVADALNYTDAGDMTAAADASRGFWESPSVGNAAELAAAGGALAIPFVGARMIDDGVDVLGDAIRSGKDDIGRFAADEAGAVPLYGGGMSDPTQTGWTFKDVDRSLVTSATGADNRRISADTSRIETLPIRELYAMQPSVNPDFADTASSSGELPLVVRKNGKLFVRDGHHRITKASEEGAQQVKSRFIDLDARDTATPLLDYDPSANNLTQADDDLLRELGIGRADDLTPAQAQAQEILDMLKAGRASEVTDDMMAAADPMYLYDNYDLPMDEASRMARAREMGFDTDAYHGTGYGGFDAFSSEESRVGGATYADIDPNVASVYARYGDTSQVYPVTMRADSPERFDLLSWDPQRETKAFDYARANGHDAYYATDGRRIAFDPTNIRSRFARFDPRLSHLRNLSAGVAGAAALGANDEDTNMMSILGMPSQSALRDYLK